MSGARITIERVRPDELGEQYLITMTLDGERIGRLLPGESVSREVAPGRHRLRAHNTLLWKTVELEIADGEHVRFITTNRPNWATFVFSFVGIGPLAVTLERATT